MALNITIKQVLHVEAVITTLPPHFFFKAFITFYILMTNACFAPVLSKNIC